MAEEQEKIYKIKIPVYVSELVKRDRQALFQTTTIVHRKPNAINVQKQLLFV